MGKVCRQILGALQLHHVSILESEPCKIAAYNVQINQEVHKEADRFKTLNRLLLPSYLIICDSLDISQALNVPAYRRH